MVPPLIGVLTGPTGAGKTDLALWAAERLNAEIVNADAMQVYRFMDIGTAKPLPEERKRVPHHLLDVVDPDEPFDAARFRAMAAEAIQGIRSRGRAVLVVGGTGLYIRALLHGLFLSPPSASSTRAALREEALRLGSQALHARLAQVDPVAGERIHPNDAFRIVRALEVYQTTGTPISRYHRAHGFREASFRNLYAVLDRPRIELYRRIEERVDQMIEQGLVEEVRGLLSMGYHADLKPMKSIGYRHMTGYVQGETRFEAAVETMKRDTRRYAKRQVTWFKAVEEARWFHPEDRERVLRFFEPLIPEVC